MIPSVSISVWTPRLRTPLSSSSEHTAFGIAPIPICRHAPSSISLAISRATARSASVGADVRQLRERLTVAFDDVVDLALVQAVLDAVHVRHGRVGLDDDDLGAGRDRAVPEVRGAEVEEPVGVDGTGLDHHDVGRVDEPAVVVADLAEVARDVVLQAGVALLAVVAAEVPVEEVEVLARRDRPRAPPGVARSGTRGCSRREARRPARPAPGRTRRAGRAPRRSRASRPNAPVRPRPRPRSSSRLRGGGHDR